MSYFQCESIETSHSAILSALALLACSHSCQSGLCAFIQTAEVCLLSASAVKNDKWLQASVKISNFWPGNEKFFFKRRLKKKTKQKKKKTMPTSNDCWLANSANVWETLWPICPHRSLNINSWSTGGILYSVVSLHSSLAFFRVDSAGGSGGAGGAFGFEAIWFSSVVLPHFSYPLSPCQGVIAAPRSR